MIQEKVPWEVGTIVRATSTGKYGQTTKEFDWQGEIVAISGTGKTFTAITTKTTVPSIMKKKFGNLMAKYFEAVSVKNWSEVLQ